MSDVSGNENLIDQEENISDQEENISDQEENVSGNDSFNPSTESGDDYVSEPHTSMEITGDYTAHLENIETCLQFQTAVIIGFLLLVGFIIGWKHD